MNFIVKCQKSDAHKVNVIVPQVSVIVPGTFLLYIRHLSRGILRTVVNIYAADTAIFGSISDGHNDQRLASNLSAEFALTSQWSKNWFAIFSAWKKSVIIVPSQRNCLELSPVIMNVWTLREFPYFDSLLELNSPRPWRRIYVLSKSKMEKFVSLLILYRYFHMFRWSPYFSQTSQIFADKNWFNESTFLNPHNFFRFLLVRNTFQWGKFFPKLPSRIGSRLIASPINTIFISSSLELKLIHPLYTNKMHFLVLHLTLVSQNPFSICVCW